MANVEIPEGLEELFEQSWFDHVLHYGLLAGAIFQLICIAAIVVLPYKPEEESEQDLSRQGSSRETSSLDESGVATKTGGGGTGNVAGGVSSKKSAKKARKRK